MERREKVIFPDITYEINGAVMQFESGNPFLQFAVQELVRRFWRQVLEFGFAIDFFPQKRLKGRSTT